MRNRTCLFIAFVFALGFASEAALATDRYTPCPPGSTHIKYGRLDGTHNEFIAPDSYLYAAYQTKAGRDHQPQVLVDPPSEKIVVVTEKDLSHIHVCKVREPPPPEERCEYDFRLENVDFDFGWTDDLGASPGAGCGNREAYIGDPGEELRFDVCLDADVVGGELLEGELPYFSSTVYSVEEETYVADGLIILRYGDPDFEMCETQSLFGWFLQVISTHDTDFCQPSDPCWCENFPEDPTCQPSEPPCRAWADLVLGAAIGDDIDACRASMGHRDIALPLPFDETVVTFCWHSRGTPELRLLAKLDTGETFEPFLSSEITVPIPRGCGGYFSLISRTEECSDHDMIRFSTDIPEVCLPWIP